MAQTVTPENQVDFHNPEYNAMAPGWKLIDALMGGTRAMKASGQEWLPKEEKEPPDKYKVRLSRAVLFNGYKKAVKDLSRRPFSKPVSLAHKSPLPEQLAGIQDRVDSEGRNLTQFCRQLLEVAINRGLVHILADYPQEPAATKREERERELQPLFSCIDPSNLIGWKYETAANGEKVLTQIRIAETASRDDGVYGVKIKNRIRIIEPAGWRLYQLGGDKNDEWVVIEEGPWTVGKITLATAYLTPTGFMTADPPLEDLAHINLAHYQTLSDHRNFLRFAQTGLVCAFGFTKEEGQSIIWGLNNVAVAENPNGKVEVKEFTGTAAKAGDDHLNRLETMMEAMGMQPRVIKQWGSETAMGRAIDEGKGQCDLQSWVRAVEGAVKRAYADAAEWVGVKLPDDFGVDIFDDFGLSLNNAGDLDWLLKARQGGEIDQETFLTEAKVRAALSETMDVKQIITRLKREGPALGMFGREKGEGDTGGGE